MTREKFDETLEDFDIDSFGKDNEFDNADVYQVMQFVGNILFNEAVEPLQKEIEKLKESNRKLQRDLGGRS